MNKKLTKGGKPKLIFKPIITEETFITPINTDPIILPTHSTIKKPTNTKDISINISQFKPMVFTNENEPQLINFLENDFGSETEFIIEIDDLSSKYKKVVSENLIVEENGGVWQEVGFVKQMWVEE